MQLLDYMQSKRYGRDLTFDDIDLPSFLEAARDCDTQSEITVLSLADPAIGDRFEFVASGKTHFSGVVKSKEASGLGSLKNITFHKCYGKLANRWIDYRV